jgi:hypothetical protein
MEKENNLAEEILAEDLYMNGQKVTLKKPGTDYLGDFLKVMRDVTKAKEGENPISCMSDDTLHSLTKLINATLDVSFPEMWKSDKLTVKQWGMQNSMILMFKIIDMCSPQDLSHESQKKKRILENIERDKRQTDK